MNDNFNRIGDFIKLALGIHSMKLNPRPGKRPKQYQATFELRKADAYSAYIKNHTFSILSEYHYVNKLFLMTLIFSIIAYIYAAVTASSLHAFSLKTM